MGKSSVAPIKCVHAAQNSRGFWALIAQEEQVLFKGKTINSGKALTAFITSATEDLSSWVGQEFTEAELRSLGITLKARD